MDIVHIVLGKANPNRMNGVNKVVYQLASKQADAGKNVEVWGITDDVMHNYGERNFTTRLFKKQSNPFAISKDLAKDIANAQNTVFHIHGGWIPTFYTIVKLTKKHKKTAVITPHGAYNTIAMEKNKWFKRAYFFLFEKPLLQSVKKIHCIGKSEKDGLLKIYPNTKQVVIPYGFEFNPKIIAKNDNSEFTVGFVGRIDIFTKGLDLLTAAFSRFTKDKNAKLWIVGDSNEMPALKQRVNQLSLNNSTRLYGSKFGEEKDSLIQQMDVFTHPSRNEGLPTAVLEAASFGIPSIVTKATNVAEYINKYNAGIAIQNNSVDSLTAALDKLYNIWKMKKLSSYAENSRKMLNQEFNWGQIVTQFDGIYS